MKDIMIEDWDEMPKDNRCLCEISINESYPYTCSCCGKRWRL